MRGITDGIAPTSTPIDTDVPRCRVPELLQKCRQSLEEIAMFFTNAVFIIRRTKAYECKYPDYYFLAHGQT